MRFSGGILKKCVNDKFIYWKLLALSTVVRSTKCCLALRPECTKWTVNNKEKYKKREKTYQHFVHFLSPIHGVFWSTCERSHKSDSIRFSLITYFGTTYVCHIHFLWQIQLAPFTQQTNSLWRLFDERPSWTQHYVSMVPRKDPIGISTRRLSSGPSLRFRIKRTGGRDGLDLP